MSDPTSPQSTAVATTSAKRTFQQLVESDTFKAQIMAALPTHLTPERFIRVLMTATIKNPKLLECTQESMFKGIFDCAAAGLEIDGRRAHLVPFRNNKKGIMEATLILDYKGIAELVLRSGVVSTIHADVVCENDIFEENRGQVIKHTIDRKKERGDMYAVYCIIVMKDGGEKCEVMGKHEVDAIRRRSKSANDGPWVTDYSEMAKKTVFKRASKWVPLSPEIRNVLEQEEDNDPINVTPKKTSLADAIGMIDTTPAATDQADNQQTPDASTVETKDATPSAKVYTQAEHDEVLKQVEDLMLSSEVGESKIMVYAYANKLAVEGQDEIAALSAESLIALLAVIPTLKKK